VEMKPEMRANANFLGVLRARFPAYWYQEVAWGLGATSPCRNHG
jgi:hypothetical protein